MQRAQFAGAHLHEINSVCGQVWDRSGLGGSKVRLVSNPEGNAFALIEFDAVFRFSGSQIGWWFGDHIRDRYGRVVLARPSAKIDGLAMPRPQESPEQAKIYLPSGRPVLQWLLPPPMKQHAWGILSLCSAAAWSE